MKFGQEFARALESEDFPARWRESAIEYKHLKKCIKKIHRELEEIGLNPATVGSLHEWLDPMSPEDEGQHRDSYFSAVSPSLSTVKEEFAPQLRVLVDSQTGVPLDATLAPDTRDSLQKLAKHEMVTSGRKQAAGATLHSPNRPSSRRASAISDIEASSIVTTDTRDSRWIQIPLASAKDFFDLLAPQVEELERLREAETAKLEGEILDLGDDVEDVVEPVREGYEATRSVSYRDLYFWREMFRLYLEQPIFYSEKDGSQGALTFKEAKQRLEAFDEKLRQTGVLNKMKTALAQRTAQRFLDLNVEILKVMHFQEMNARAMAKILKKFDKRTHLDGEGAVFLRDVRSRYPALLEAPNGANGQNNRLAVGSFTHSIARDLNAEMATKVLAIVPQLQDWTCPVCYAIAWLPVRVSCCGATMCLRCVMQHQSTESKQCPICDKELKADTRNLDFDTMDFLEKFFPIEVRKRQEENERAALAKEHADITHENEEHTKCVLM